MDGSWRRLGRRRSNEREWKPTLVWSMRFFRFLAQVEEWKVAVSLSHDKRGLDKSSRRKEK